MVASYGLWTNQPPSCYRNKVSFLYPKPMRAPYVKSSGKCTLLFVLLFSFFIFAQQSPVVHPSKHGGRMFELTSTAFSPQGDIPRQFTCQGQDVSPELTW